MKKSLKKYFFLDISCPGDQNPCSGSGICDLAIGECTCNEGHQGSDCSGEKLFVKLWKHKISFKSNHIDYLFIELTCPADCSNSGVCDTSSGLCSCDTGRHGSDCSSKNL